MAKKPKLPKVSKRQGYRPPPVITAYTDGSYRPPQFGSWAFILTKGDKVIHYGAEGVEHTTINQMELMAIEKALEAIRPGCAVVVISDSQYAIKTLSIWCKFWKKSGWVTGTGAPVKNREIIERIEELTKKFSSIKYVHVYGHRGNRYNECCDVLAQGITYQALFNHKRNNPEITTEKKEPKLLAV